MNQPLTRPRATRDLKAALRGGREAWWFKAATDAFGFLEHDYGYVLTVALAHFRGYGLEYQGTAYTITIGFEPNLGILEDPMLRLVEERDLASYPRVMSILDLLEARAPDTDWDRGALKRTLSLLETLSAMTLWADGLKEHGQDLLASKPLAGVVWLPLSHYR